MDKSSPQRKRQPGKAAGSQSCGGPPRRGRGRPTNLGDRGGGWTLVAFSLCPFGSELSHVTESGRYHQPLSTLDKLPPTARSRDGGRASQPAAFVYCPWQLDCGSPVEQRGGLSISSVRGIFDPIYPIVSISNLATSHLRRCSRSSPFADTEHVEGGNT